jgi:hypothetical protein
VHVYCRTCALGMLRDAETRGVRLQCAVCRRVLARTDLSVLDLDLGASSSVAAAAAAATAVPPLPLQDVRALATHVRDAEAARAVSAAEVVWHGLKLAEARAVNQQRLATTRDAGASAPHSSYAQTPGAAHTAHAGDQGPLAVPSVPFAETTLLPRTAELPAQHPWLTSLWPTVPSLSIDWMHHWHDICHNVTGSKVCLWLLLLLFFCL